MSGSFAGSGSLSSVSSQFAMVPATGLGISMVFAMVLGELSPYALMWGESISRAFSMDWSSVSENCLDCPSVVVVLFSKEQYIKHPGVLIDTRLPSQVGTDYIFYLGAILGSLPFPKES